MTILENMSMADHKGKFFGLSMGTNKSRIPFYQEQLRQLNLGWKISSSKSWFFIRRAKTGNVFLMSTMTPLTF